MGEVEVTTLVVGGESTGTRLMAEIVTAMGGQPIHRSFPYGVEHAWPVLAEIEFDSMVIMVRNWEATIRSQLRVGHVTESITGLFNLQSAYTKIFEQIPLDKPYIVVPYEGLVHDTEQTLRSIAFAIPGLSLNFRVLPEITNGNEKYNEG